MRVIAHHLKSSRTTVRFRKAVVRDFVLEISAVQLACVPVHLIPVADELVLLVSLHKLMLLLRNCFVNLAAREGLAAVLAAPETQPQAKEEYKGEDDDTSGNASNCATRQSVGGAAGGSIGVRSGYGT